MWKRGATVQEVADQFEVKRGAIYTALRKTGELPPLRRREGPTCRASAVLKNRPAPINRDPCIRCGTRADFGCAHSRRAFRFTNPRPQGLRLSEGAM